MFHHPNLYVGPWLLLFCFYKIRGTSCFETQSGPLIREIEGNAQSSSTTSFTQSPNMNLNTYLNSPWKSWRNVVSSLACAANVCLILAILIITAKTDRWEHREKKLEHSSLACQSRSCWYALLFILFSAAFEILKVCCLHKKQGAIIIYMYFIDTPMWLFCEHVIALYYPKEL